MTNREAFKRNLKRLMSKKDCNQADMCRYLDVTSSTVSSWVTGQKYPRTDTMEQIAKFFGVSIFELVCEDDSDEEKLLHTFRLLSPLGKKKALERMDELQQLYWYNKENAL